jgi:hypothetical protein
MIQQSLGLMFDKVYGREYVWDGTLSHSGASIYIDKYGNGEYFNGDQATRSLQGGSMNDTVMWYGSFPGECQVTCVKTESSHIFCSFNMGSTDFYFISDTSLNTTANIDNGLLGLGLSFPHVYGSEYWWNGTVNHDVGAVINEYTYAVINADGNGNYYNGDANQRTLKLNSPYSDTVMWYGSFPGECQVTCVKTVSGRIFCSFNMGSTDWHFMSSGKLQALAVEEA